MIEQQPTGAGYARISNDREGRRLGVDRQEEDYTRLAGDRGYVIPTALRFDDNDLSASTNSNKPRPDYKRMIEAVRDGRVTAIFAYSSSRLTRRPRELEDLIDLAEQTGVRIYTVRSGDYDLNTARGRSRARDDARRDAEYAEEISENVKRAAQQRAERGLWSGSAMMPQGLRYVRDVAGRITGVEHEPAGVALDLEAVERLRNGESAYGITRDWNARGLLTPRGNRWRENSFRITLTSPSLAALTRTKDGRLHRAVWEPVVDRETWEWLCEELSPHRPSTKRPNAAKLALGGGLTLCTCKTPMGKQPRANGDRLMCPPGGNGCRAVGIKYAPLEDFVLRMLWARLNSAQFRRSMAARSIESAQDAQRRTALRSALKSCEAGLDRGYAAYLAGNVEESRYLEHKAELERERDRLRGALEQLTGSGLRGMEPDAARERWDTADVTWRRTFLASVIKAVVVAPSETSTRVRQRANETDEQFAARSQEFWDDVMRQRVSILWRV